ncbi:hypothetical protein HUT18_07735 [Streptomyces sp. NA04227]|uniref:hypothetical protein n=1 Tax=Streptomyces sp. NA04227 TaxID=2742136 RepID=UPI0015911DE4|nr:hypothetical protein [Streptomyces sp. NA04227]QKW06311.1 hypothetical protein HUT18_07735 [Streptomyces sp. NA04227]
MQHAGPPSRRSFLGRSAAFVTLAVSGSLAAIPNSVALPGTSARGTARPRSVSGVFPSLAMFNDEGECGTGAVVAWAGRLWAITYGPHLVRGSSDKLYEITPDLDQIVRPESVGGTNANRMIHRETRQLVIGPYVIDGEGRVRVIPREEMPGRLTGTARHLTDPANRVYVATMEEGLYSVDLNSLEVYGEIKDGNGGLTSPDHPAEISSELPGYHGKGLYSGGSVLVYSNNGDQAPEAETDPKTVSGALAEWRGEGDWSLVRRNQFTEVSGPAGIFGGNDSASDPLWSVGWDYRSVLLNVLYDGEWHTYRLPKASHCYDGAHGWNTEWPRIRDIGETDLLMTMHGAMWRFPAAFRPGRTAGLAQRSTYLRVVGDFTRWGDRIVFGCDDTARLEFLNKRRHKGNIVGPGQSQSNLWFADPDRLDALGTPLGRGAVWDRDHLAAGEVSDPFLLAGFARRSLHLTHSAEHAVTFTVEIDRNGTGTWDRFRRIEVPAGGYRWTAFPAGLPVQWARLRVDRDCPDATAAFALSEPDRRTSRPARIFDGLARIGEDTVTGGIVRARGGNLRTLAFVSDRPAGSGQESVGYYELDGELALSRVEDPESERYHREKVAVPTGMYEVDAASVLVIDDSERRWRLPKGNPAFDQDGPLGPERLDREVCTERDLFNCHGTLYELPAENAGGFARMRPVASHELRIKDYCSYRGLIVLTGVRDDAPAGEHIVRSDDGRTALWAGAVDDLWQLGLPRGEGGPWARTSVRKGEHSDPYLMTGYEDKVLRLSHDHAETVGMTVQVDITGDGRWCVYRTFAVAAGSTVTHRFPEDFSAYWVRCVTDTDCSATAQLRYGRG